jgi:uncharacterized protein YqfA (UPF0365 family)
MISFFQKIEMTLRGVPVRTIIEAHEKTKREGITIERAKPETHHLSGGNVLLLADSLIAAKKAGVRLEIEEAMAPDLSPENPLEAVIQKRIVSRSKNF